MRNVEDRELEAPGEGGGYGGRAIRVAIVASHSLSLLGFATALDRRLSELPGDTIILLRQPVDKRRTSSTDMAAAELARIRGLQVEWFVPEPGGRNAVYDRDYALVGSADRVEAFFEDDAMPGGTGHVVDAALARNRTVYAWRVQGRGELVRIGDWETDEDVSFG